jgi:glycosyltransferase involved in cell wall biosynthesis
MTAPAVSVVVATYNQAQWLDQTIASVRGQQCEDWELIVVDDGSTDGTAAVVARYATDARIRCLRQARQERAAARNRGIAESTGRLVAFLDADDVWRPEKLARQLAALEREPAAAFCYTLARFVDASGNPLPLRKPPHALGGCIFPALMRANRVILSSVLARRAILEEVGAFDATLPALGCEDWDLWLRLARRHPVAVVDEELTLYRQHPGNTSWRRVMESGLAVIDKHYGDPAVAREAGLSRAAARARLYWYNAGIAASVDRAAALPLMMQALRELPRTAVSRPAAGAMAALVLPPAAVRALGRIGR